MVDWVQIRTQSERPLNALARWRGALAQDWCAQDEDAVATLFMDGHVKVYTGRGQLAKQFVPRQ